MERWLRIFALGFVAVWAVACNPASKFAVIDFDDLSFNGLSSVHTRAVVENSSNKELTVESATLVFGYKTRELATARLMLPVTVHAHSTERMRIDLRLEDTTLARLQTLERHAATNPDRLRVSVRACVRFGKMRRTVEARDVPLSAIIHNFEPVNQKR
jgi:hypothetical protein